MANGYTPGKTSITVTKSWQDNKDQYGKRPDEITVLLLADGAETGKTLVLNNENMWMGSFSDLDEFKLGQKIVYTVKEVSVNGYKTVIRGDAETGFTITNIYNPTLDYPPQTGDETSLSLWIMMCFMAILGIFATAYAYRYKKR